MRTRRSCTNMNKWKRKIGVSFIAQANQGHVNMSTDDGINPVFRKKRGNFCLIDNLFAPVFSPRSQQWLMHTHKQQATRSKFFTCFR